MRQPGGMRPGLFPDMGTGIPRQRYAAAGAGIRVGPCAGPCRARGAGGLAHFDVAGACDGADNYKRQLVIRLAGNYLLGELWDGLVCSVLAHGPTPQRTHNATAVLERLGRRQFYCRSRSSHALVHDRHKWIERWRLKKPRAALHGGQGPPRGFGAAVRFRRNVCGHGRQRWVRGRPQPMEVYKIKR